MEFLNNIKCFFGFHDYKRLPFMCHPVTLAITTYKDKCKHCNKVRYVDVVGIKVVPSVKWRN